MDSTAIATIAAVSLGISGAHAQSLPQGGNVVAGSATITQTSSTRLDVNQSTNRAVINWDSFNIAAGHHVNIAQPSASSMSIQQVVGPSPSQIFGMLTSNGRVVIANPNGIYVGPGAIIDVAAIVATTARLSQPNAEGFVAGTAAMVFDVAGRADASVVNEGTITVAERGLAALVAPGVRNSGLIEARLGEVRLAAGNRMTVDFYGDGLFSFAITEQAGASAKGPDGRSLGAAVDNSGTIRAVGGRVILTAAVAQTVLDTAINMGGVIQANSASVTETGAVVLEGRGASGFVNVGGTIEAKGVVAGESGGSVSIEARVLGFNGTVDASGNAAGGSVAVDAATVIHQGTIRADATVGAGGQVDIVTTAAYMDVSRSVNSARGGTAGDGGRVRVRATGSAEGRVFSSGSHQAGSAGGKGGSVELLAASQITLYDARVDATGETGGGTILVGGDYQGGNGVVQAATTIINPSTSLTANARTTGNGGKVIVWSTTETIFAGTISARGGAISGNGGLIEVSSTGSYVFAGSGDAGATNGLAGSLLIDPKNIVIDATSGSYPSFDLVNPGSTSGDNFGASVTLLSGGNIVVTNTNDSDVASNAGSVYLYNGTTGALISTLYGTTASDNVGSVSTLSNGHYVIRSVNWDNGTAANAGAVTWGSGTSGIAGAVSATNSLVGTTANSGVGSNGIGTLSNGNYVVLSGSWRNGTATNAGAVTWGSGTSGIVGAVSATNSLVGTSNDDFVGQGFTNLSNGNYLIRSTNWNNGTATDAGAITWGNGTTGVVGVVSATISLVGTTANDRVGNSLFTLSNGNYVVGSSAWANGTATNAGALTWGSGTSGIAGAVSATNSLVGTTANDAVGSFDVIRLSNGNFVVLSTAWVNGTASEAGAVTWGSGTTGIVGAVSATNSLVGTSFQERVGITGIVALSNGNYVVRSTQWDNGTATDAGAVTWGSGTSGIAGTISATNSLVGTSANDRVGLSITSLSNGNYVVRSVFWRNGTATSAGAATWGSGTSGIVGAVSSTNSLVGTSTNDLVGSVIALSNGSYVVASGGWANGTATNAGAVTWGSGTSGIVGAVSATNSLVGTSTNDSFGNVTTLANGNYVVISTQWRNGTAANAGAVTWVSGTGSIAGAVSATNSLVGTTANDAVGSGGVTTLSNGNYVIPSSYWDNGTVTDAGAVTWASGTSGVAGVVSATNSLVGTTSNDLVGQNSILTLSNGNYIVPIDTWDNGTASNAGAVTWGSGTSGIAGAVSATNSLVGTSTNDNVGGGVTTLSNGNFIVRSFNWDNGTASNAGAVTWGNGTSGIAGAVSVSNSLVGTTASDQLGASVLTLSNGSYVIQAVTWDNGTAVNAGAVTWGSGTSGVVGAVSVTNSLLGTSTNDNVGSAITTLSNGNYVVRSTAWDNGTATDAGAVTWGSGTSGAVGTVSATNSLVGTSSNGSMGASLVSNSDVFVASGASANRVIVASAAPGNVSFAFGQSQTVSITPTIVTSILNTGTALTLQASNDITVNSAVSVNNASGNGGAFTLQAGRSILLNANIVTDNGNLSLIANERLSAGVIDGQRDAGAAVVAMAAGTSIDAGTGTVTIDLRDGAGKTNTTSGAVSLRDISASEITVLNQGSNSGNLVLDGTLTGSGSGNAVVLSTLGNFVNNTGASAIAASSGRYLVYSTTPGSNTLGGLAGTNLYGRTYSANAPGTITQTGNRFIHSVTPTLTLTADNQTRLYGASNPSLTYTASGLLGGDSIGYAVTGTPTISTGATASSNVGSYTITTAAGTAASDVGYTLAYANGTLTVNQASLTIAADNASRTYGASNPTLTATYTGLVNGDTSSVVSGLSLSTAATAASNAGSYAITAAGGTATNYAITRTNGTLTVNQASLTVAAANASRTYGASNPTFTATYTGFVNGDTSSVVSGLSLATAATAASNVGTYSISGSGASATNYNISYTAGTLTVNQASLTVTANNATRTYGAANPSFTSSYTGLLNGDAGSVVSGLSYSTTAGLSSAVGTYGLSVSGGAATNYAISYGAAAQLSVTAAPLTVTANNASRVAGAANPTFSASYSGFVNGETASIVSGLSIASPATTGSAAGSYAITPSGATAPNYTVSFVNGVLTVTAAATTTSTTTASVNQGVVAAERVTTALPVPPSPGVPTIGGFSVGGVSFNTAAILLPTTSTPLPTQGVGTTPPQGPAPAPGPATGAPGADALIPGGFTGVPGAPAGNPGQGVVTPSVQGSTLAANNFANGLLGALGLGQQ